MKALYRRAQAYIQLVDLDLAEMDIKKALEIDPDNRWDVLFRHIVSLRSMVFYLLNSDYTILLRLPKSQRCENGIQVVEGESEGVQQEGCSILRQYIHQDEQIRSSKISCKFSILGSPLYFVMILILLNPLAFTEWSLFEILIHRMRP